jgi:hypothetical protein
MVEERIKQGEKSAKYGKERTKKKAEKGIK